MPIVERTRLQRSTFLVLFAMATYLFWRTLEPVWIPVFLGMVIAVGVYPLHEKMLDRFRKHPGIPAGLLTAGVMLLLLAFLAFLVLIVGHRLLEVAQQAADRYKDKGATGMLGPQVTNLLSRVGVRPDNIEQRFGEVIKSAAGTLGKGAGALLAGTFSMMFILIFTALTSYYLLIEGREGTSWLVETIPLPNGQVRAIVNDVRDVTRAMLMGTGVTAAYQGVIAFIGYWIFGVDSPIVWASLTGIASILPGIGTALVWIPVGIFTIAQGHAGKGAGILAWGAILIVFVADYVLRPKLVGTKMKMNDLLVFVAIFGGIEAFGILGLVLGPIAVAVLLSLIRIYQQEYRPEGPARTPDPTAPEGSKKDS